MGITIELTFYERKENEMTRREYLNELSNEEFAEFLGSIIGDCCGCPVWSICGMDSSKCQSSLMKYINEEVKVETIQKS